MPKVRCVVDEKEFETLKEEVQLLRTMFQTFQVKYLSSSDKSKKIIWYGL